MISEGAAFLDRSGRVLAADAGFRTLLGLPAGDASEALRRRAAADPVLALLLAGDGPESVSLSGADGVPACLLSRHASDDGLLLRAVVRESLLGAPILEFAMQAVVLARLAGSIAHEVKNPLNAMALQLALLGEKIDAAGEAIASSCAGHLGSLKNQIGRINDIVRRYLDVADPSPSVGFDAGALLADAAYLFGHEARRRRITLSCEPTGGAVRAAGDPGRAARVLLGLFWREVTTTAEGGRFVARAAGAGPEVLLSLEHTRGSPDPASAWMPQVLATAAAAMGGRLEWSDGDLVRVALSLPKERLP
jgi:signal transduction histidine kinase